MRELKEKFPQARVLRPTFWRWRKENPSIINTIAVAMPDGSGPVAYVVCGRSVTLRDALHATGNAVDLDVDLRENPVIIYAHAEASVDENVLKHAEEEGVVFRFVKGIPYE